MRRRGFTFIEMLLVTALMASLSLAIFLCLSNGLKLWQRTQQALLQEDVAIFFDKFSGDLRNAFSFSTLAIEGRENSFVFPTIVWMRTDRGSVRAAEEFVDQLGRVRYEFNAADGVLTRQQANYSQGTRKVWADTAPQVIFHGATEVRFKYFYSGRKGDEFSTEAKGGLPSGVEVDVRYKEGQEERTYQRFFPVPLGI
jgi:prepilin-type N-terminal cleavage/methylation domain-containing protein